MIYSLVSITFDSPQFDKLNFDFLGKGLGIVSLRHSVCNFSRKTFLMLYSINWPNFITWLWIVFTSWGIGKYVSCNCLLTRLWRHRFSNLRDFSNQNVFLYDEEVKAKIWISWEQKELLRWNEKHFSSFLMGFQMPKIDSNLRMCA